MATLVAQNIIEAGLTATYAAVAASDVFANPDGKAFLHVKNGGVASTIVTVTAANTTANNNQFGTLTKSNVTKTILAGGEAFIGPFAVGAFQNSGGNTTVSCSVLTSVTIAVLRLP